MAVEKSGYALLGQARDLDCEDQRDVVDRYAPKRRALAQITILFLLASNFVLAALLWQHSGPLETSFTGVHTAPRRWRTMEWASHYAVQEDSNNTEAVDDAWYALKPAHGFVAVDPDWAAERGLEPSMELPSDRSRHVYILEAYHLLHCLKVIRRTFYQVKRGEMTSYKINHADHCFDALRQNVICNADDSMLYTFGRGIAGDGQQRSCRNWDALRDWATQNTACYRDVEDHEAGLFYRCDDGDDGLIWDPPSDSGSGQ